jgi:hypothetical protein
LKGAAGRRLFYVRAKGVGGSFSPYRIPGLASYSGSFLLSFQQQSEARDLVLEMPSAGAPRCLQNLPIRDGLILYRRCSQPSRRTTGTAAEHQQERVDMGHGRCRGVLK